MCKLLLVLFFSLVFNAPLTSLMFIIINEEKQLNQRIDSKHPTVFITFERKGKRTPLHYGESDEGIWLRLHNNTRWTLSFKSFGVPKELGEIGFFYEVEKVVTEETGSIFQESKAEEMPLGYRVNHFYSPFLLQPGKSITFSIPLEHLGKNRKIAVSFNYEWENKGKHELDVEPQHKVFFYSSKIP